MFLSCFKITRYVSCGYNRNFSIKTYKIECACSMALKRKLFIFCKCKFFFQQTSLLHRKSHFGIITQSINQLWIFHCDFLPYNNQLIDRNLTSNIYVYLIIHSLYVQFFSKLNVRQLILTHFPINRDHIKKKNLRKSCKYFFVKISTIVTWAK